MTNFPEPFRKVGKRLLPKLMAVFMHPVGQRREGMLQGEAKRSDVILHARGNFRVDGTRDQPALFEQPQLPGQLFLCNGCGGPQQLAKPVR